MRTNHIPQIMSKLKSLRRKDYVKIPQIMLIASVNISNSFTLDILAKNKGKR